MRGVGLGWAAMRSRMSAMSSSSRLRFGMITFVPENTITRTFSSSTMRRAVFHGCDIAPDAANIRRASSSNVMVSALALASPLCCALAETHRRRMSAAIEIAVMSAKVGPYLRMPNAKNTAATPQKIT